MILDDNLNFVTRKYPLPEIRLVSEQNGWQILQIEKVRFFWPTIYSMRGLVALYNDTFAPYKDNPHAYEFGNVCIRPGSWVIDAGACEGFFASYALSRGANVLLIEPVPLLGEALSFTYEKEIKEGRVRLLKGAIGAKAGMIDLQIPSGGPIVASTDPSWTVNQKWDLTQPSTHEKVTISVNIFTLDNILFKDKLIPTVDFIKMDIENAEVGAIKGAEELLYRFSPKLSIAVYHDYVNAQLIRTLVQRVQPHYRVCWRGIFYRKSFGKPRPFMLYAHV